MVDENNILKRAEQILSEGFWVPRAIQASDPITEIGSLNEAKVKVISVGKNNGLVTIEVIWDKKTEAFDESGVMTLQIEFDSIIHDNFRKYTDVKFLPRQKGTRFTFKSNSEQDALKSIKNLLAKATKAVKRFNRADFNKDNLQSR